MRAIGGFGSGEESSGGGRSEKRLTKEWTNGRSVGRSVGRWSAGRKKDLKRVE